MSKVTIKVGPKSYSFATADGDEERITALGQLVDEKYAQLGNSRAVQETDNLVFAALFLADELDETRKLTTEADARIAAADKAADQAREDAAKAIEECDAKIASAIAEARKEADQALSKATETVEQEKEKSGGKKAELRAEIDTLRKAEERAREENNALKEELADLREASRHQHDLFGSDALSDDWVEKLEKLAERAEETAAALEGATASD